jgi:hypothetical protein
MGFMVNRVRRPRAWRQGLLVGLAAVLLAA